MRNHLSPRRTHTPSPLKNKRKTVETKGHVKEQDTDSLPTDWIPTWEIPVVLKGADLAIKGGEKLVEWFRAEGPLSVQMLDEAPGEKVT